MNRILFIFAAVCSVCLVKAQGVNADCVNAINLCNSPSFTFFATSGPGNTVDFTTSDNISNPTNDPFPPNFGSLKSGELNPMAPRNNWQFRPARVRFWCQEQRQSTGRVL